MLKEVSFYDAILMVVKYLNYKDPEVFVSKFLKKFSNIPSKVQSKRFADEIWACYILIKGGDILEQVPLKFGSLISGVVNTKMRFSEKAMKAHYPNLPRFYTRRHTTWRSVDVEILPVWDNLFGIAEPCEVEDATYWSVFFIYPYGIRECIADLATKEQAESLVTMIAESLLILQMTHLK